MEGARWDDQTGCIMDSLFKELFPLLPIIYIYQGDYTGQARFKEYV